MILYEICAKYRTSSQMPNILLCCTFTASAMVEPLLLLKNTVSGLLCVEFRFIDFFYIELNILRECGALPSAHIIFEWVRNSMWRNRKTFLKWYSVALLLACEDFHTSWCFTNWCMAKIK